MSRPDEASDRVPDAWPPDPEEATGTGPVVPLFPLPRVWLFPHFVLPLHVFEPRYRQMVEDSLDGPGRIVLGTVVDGHEDRLAGSPPIYPIAGLGEIGRHERLPDGRFHVMLVGLERVRVSEVESDRPYRRVSVHPVEETPVPDEDETALRDRVVDAVLTRTKDLDALPPELPLTHLVDLLTLRLPLEVPVRNDLFSELDLRTRARRALSEHRRAPI